MDKNEPRPRGRPPKFDAAMLDRLALRIPDRVAKAIEEIRVQRKDGADASQIVRELLVKALEAEGRL